MAQNAGKSLDPRFFLSAANPQGESVPISTRIPPELDRLITQIISQEDSPWTTKSEFVRYALLRTAEEVASRLDDEAVPQICKLLRLWAEQAWQAKLMRRLGETLADIARQEFVVFMEDDDPDRASKRLEELATDILGIQDLFWLRRTLAAFLAAMPAELIPWLKRRGRLGEKAQALLDTCNALKIGAPDESVSGAGTPSRSVAGRRQDTQVAS